MSRALGHDGAHERALVESDGRVINYASTCTSSCAAARRCGSQSYRICYSVLDPARFPWSQGATSNPLEPDRSMAVDRDFVALGTWVYFEELDGLIPAGATEPHDGCLRRRRRRRDHRKPLRLLRRHPRSLAGVGGAAPDPQRLARLRRPPALLSPPLRSCARAPAAGRIGSTPLPKALATAVAILRKPPKAFAAAGAKLRTASKSFSAARATFGRRRQTLGGPV